jgi:ankyrin repeat protein
VYDLLSGREMAVYSANSYRGKIPVFELSANADPKSQTSSGYSQEAKEYNQSSRDISWNLTGTRTRDSSGIGTHTRDSIGIAGIPTVDYDVIIPWVLRNMLRSSTERGLESSRSGAERLKTLLESVEQSRLGVFLVAELGSVLGGLGIRVTLDILRELCRRYPANMADITEKYEWVEGMKKEEREKEKEKEKEKKQMDSLKLRQVHGRDDKGHDRSDLHHRADSKGVSKQRSASSSSKHSESDDEYDYDDDYENGSVGRRNDSKSPAKRSAQSIRLMPNKMAPLVYSSLLIDKVDENTGLDVYQLIEDISSGRGLRPIVDSRGVDEENFDITGRSSYGILTGSTGGVGRSTADCATLPSTLTVAMAVKARCAVINVCDSLGRSPLLVASALGNHGLVASLLSMGGDISIVTPDGHTAFTVAKSPSVRALPERSLLTWMNKREHSSSSASRASVDSTIRGRVERDKRKAHSRSDNLSSKTASDGVQGEGEGGNVLGNQDVNLKSSLDFSITSRTSDRDKDREGEGHREGDMLSQFNMMSVEERARAVAGLIEPLENLKLAKWAYSRPPLMWAVHNGLLSAVRGLLPSRSSSSSSSSSSGLSLCATSSQDPNCADSLGRGPLHECAALVRSAREVLVLAAVPIAEALIAAGTDLNGASVSGRTPLHELFCATQDEKVSSYRVSSDGSAAICVTTTHAVDAQLVMRCRRQLVRSLLQFGADPLILDRHGLSAMHYCAREDRADCFLEMLLKGVDGTFLTGLKQTSLHIACKSGALKVAHLLCRWDADHVATPQRRLTITQQRDPQGKIPAQLLPRAASSRCLDTLWSACRAGNLSRYLVTSYSSNNIRYYINISEKNKRSLTQNSTKPLLPHRATQRHIQHTTPHSTAHHNNYFLYSTLLSTTLNCVLLFT